jgi:hypothetical protein
VKRAGALLLLSLQLAGITASVADARLEAPGRDVGHIESERRSACRPHHDPALCQLCRVLAAAGGPPPVRHAMALEAPPRAASPAPRPLPAPARLLAADAAPRAPPTSRI